MEKLIVLCLWVMCSVNLLASEEDSSSSENISQKDEEGQSEGTDSPMDTEETQDNDELSDLIKPDDSPEDIEPDSELESNLVPSKKQLVDLNVLLSKRWYKKSPFSAQGLEIDIELGPRDLPLRIGPSIHYFDLSPTGYFFDKGTLLEFGLRGTLFWDTESFLPYLSVDYTLASSGSIEGHYREGNLEQSGALDIETDGISLIAGISYFWSGYSVILETSLSNSTNLTYKGDITTVESTEDQTNVSRSKLDNIKNDLYKSISIGVGFEF